MACDYILKLVKDGKNTPTSCVFLPRFSKAPMALLTTVPTEGCGTMVPPPTVDGKIHDGLRQETPPVHIYGLHVDLVTLIGLLLFFNNIIISYQKITTNQVLLFLLLSKCRWFFFYQLREVWITHLVVVTLKLGQIWAIVWGWLSSVVSLQSELTFLI